MLQVVVKEDAITPVELRKAELDSWPIGRVIAYWGIFTGKHGRARQADGLSKAAMIDQILALEFNDPPRGTSETPT